MELIKTHETHLRSEIFKKEHPQPARERTTINQQEKEKGNEINKLKNMLSWAYEKLRQEEKFTHRCCLQLHIP